MEGLQFGGGPPSLPVHDTLGGGDGRTAYSGPSHETPVLGPSIRPTRDAWVCASQVQQHPVTRVFGMLPPGMFWVRQP